MNKPIFEVRSYTVRVVLDEAWTTGLNWSAIDGLLADIEMLVGVMEVVGEWPDDTIFVTAGTEMWPESRDLVRSLTSIIESAQEHLSV